MRSSLASALKRLQVKPRTCENPEAGYESVACNSLTATRSSAFT